MGEVITIGLDLAENVFQVHGVDASGEVVIRKRLRRRQVMPFFGKLAPCLIGVEACATCHHWSGESKHWALRCGSCRPITSSPA